MAGEAGGAAGIYKVLISTAADGFKIETGHAMIDELFSRGGMSSMLNTVWLIICAMVFGGMMEATGVLRCLANAVLHGVASAARLIGSTIGACLLVNITASDQYISIVVPARMFRPGFDDLGLHPKNLSRAVEDAGTVTSVLVPWNTCGAFHAGVLGVPTLAYLPYCFFNILSPVVSVFLAVTGLTIERVRHAHEEGLIPTTTVARV
jgi:NhaC family Na+:H+ antiporter